MTEVILQFPDNVVRSHAYFLRVLYGKDGRTPLSTLCKIAVRQGVSEGARIELERIEKEKKFDTLTEEGK